MTSDKHKQAAKFVNYALRCLPKEHRDHIISTVIQQCFRMSHDISEPLANLTLTIWVAHEMHNLGYRYQTNRWVRKSSTQKTIKDSSKGLKLSTKPAN